MRHHSKLAAAGFAVIAGASGGLAAKPTGALSGTLSPGDSVSSLRDVSAIRALESKMSDAPPSMQLNDSEYHDDEMDELDEFMNSHLPPAARSVAE